ncbi:Gametolysin peptidase M11-domain-containing protein, partial [Haematococcus lacustris]
MCPQSGMRWTLVLVTAVLTHSFATAMTERPGTLIGTLLSLEVHGGQPSFYLRSDNYTIFHLVMAQGVSALPDGYELRGPSPRASVSYYAVEGRRLFLNAPITLLPQPSAPLQETLTLPRAMLRQSQAPPASQAAALAAGPATGTEDARRQLQTVLPRPNTFLGALPVIVYLASMCTPRGVQPAAASVQDMRSMLFGPGGLNDLYGQCSGQQANLDPINTVVMQVNIPCSGTKLDGSGPWDTTTCGNDQIFDWVDWADGRARAAGVNLGHFYHKVFVLPRKHTTFLASCGFAGLASTGMWGMEPDTPVSKPYGYGLAWIGGDFALQQSTWAHELGHNYWLSHASTAWPGQPVQEYLDYSCAMSNGGISGPAPRCFNAPHLWQVGWFPMQAEYFSADLVPNTPQQLQLPAQGSGFAGVRVWPTSALEDVLWLSFRRPTARDQPFPASDPAPSLLVHRWPANDYSAGFVLTALVARLRWPGQSYTDATSLVVAWNGMTDSDTASVTICLGEACPTLSPSFAEALTSPPPPRSPRASPPTAALGKAPPPSPRIPRPPPSSPPAQTAVGTLNPGTSPAPGAASTRTG